jgi:hypothetical protein
MRYVRRIGDYDFFRRFPDEAACRDDLLRRRFGARPVCPGCGRAARFARLAGRAAHACPWCRRQLYPAAGTPYARSHVPLILWYYAVFWSVYDRRVPSAPALQRRLGIGYAAAWRLARVLRRHFAAAWPD